MSIYHALTCAIERYRIRVWIDRGYYGIAGRKIAAYVDSTLERLGVRG
ncbi:MAG TPA: hypothetical protein PKD84_13420 [Propionicimonas sp.]|nr:hypothetical protein [Propionicimonas sp.]